MPDRPRKPFRPGHHQTPKPPRDTERPKHPERDRYDWITLWTAIIGVFIVCVGTGITAYQAVVMRRELDSVIVQQRAWLRGDPKATADIMIDEHGFGVSAQLEITNTGSMPAFGVVVDAEPRIVSREQLASGKIPFTDVCAKTEGPMEGFTVFPGQSFKITVPYRYFNATDIAGLDTIDVAVLMRSCIVYWTGAPSEIHYTQGYYWVWSEEDGNSKMYFNATGDGAALSTLAFQPLVLGNWAQ